LVLRLPAPAVAVRAVAQSQPIVAAFMREAKKVYKNGDDQREGHDG